MARSLWALGLAALTAGFLYGAPPQASADEGWQIGFATVGEIRLKPGFERFAYVDPDAPKGGKLRLSQTGTFDTLNPALAKGEAVAGLSLVFETLLKRALDEQLAAYGLLAESMKVAPDLSSVTFRLRAEARFADGAPVTPDDVVFSLDKAKEHSPRMAMYYAHVVKAEKTADNEVTFTFDKPGNRELPMIIGELPILPKHWWEGTGPNGKPRSIAATTLEPVMGSGPYQITNVDPGSSIRYERRKDYWGETLNVNVGQNNFDVVEYTYYGDRNVEFEAFKAGNTDYWAENEAKRWQTQYDFPAVKDGKIKRETPDNDYRSSGVMVGFIPNMRREKFADPRVREALNYAFDFETLNRTIFFGQYKRVNSYFFGSELASSGLPEGREKEILESLKGEIPEKALAMAYENPVGGDPKKLRDNLRKAIALFKEAGWELKGNRMVNVKTGEPFEFEILLGSNIIERVALPFSQNLKLIGIKAEVRVVDPSQYTNRWRSRDYDVIYEGWGQSINPGNEQAEYWGSKAADLEGSQNFAGIKDPAIDRLVAMIIHAPNRDEQIAAIRALDRVLLAHHFIVPTYTLRNARIAYRDTIAHPAEFPAYSTGFPEIWWSLEAGKQ